MRILLIEDDKMIGEGLSHALKAGGYAVDWARDGETGEESLKNATYHLVLLDLGLPRRGGLEVLQSMRRAHNKTPVLVLTARDRVADKVLGLNLGADDYLVKPFALEEVEARIRVLLRRNTGNAESVIRSGAIALNTTTKELTYRGKELVLSAREYALMFALMEVPGKVLSRAELEDRLYGWNEEVSSNAVEVQIHNVRKKLGSDIIHNIRGIGYMVAK
jgi:two-component system response regulator QseB